MYGFSFPTGGGHFNFYIDKENFIHVATARSAQIYTFFQGNLVFQRGYKDSQEKNEIINEYAYISRNTKEFQDNEGFIYKVMGNHTVQMIDEDTGEVVRIIKPKVPIWPFSTFMFWGIFAIRLATWEQ